MVLRWLHQLVIEFGWWRGRGGDVYVPGEDNTLLAAPGLEELAGDDREDQNSDQEPEARKEHEQFVVVGPRGSTHIAPYEGAESDRQSVEAEEYSMIFARKSQVQYYLSS